LVVVDSLRQDIEGGSHGRDPWSGVTKQTHADDLGEVDTFVDPFAGNFPARPQELLHVGGQAKVAEGGRGEGGGKEGRTKGGR